MHRKSISLLIYWPKNKYLSGLMSHNGNEKDLLTYILGLVAEHVKRMFVKANILIVKDLTF